MKMWTKRKQQRRSNEEHVEADCCSDWSPTTITGSCKLLTGGNNAETRRVEWDTQHLIRITSVKSTCLLSGRSRNQSRHFNAEHFADMLVDDVTDADSGSNFEEVRSESVVKSGWTFVLQDGAKQAGHCCLRPIYQYYTQTNNVLKSLTIIIS